MPSKKHKHSLILHRKLMMVLEIVTIQMKNTGKKIAIIRNHKRQVRSISNSDAKVLSGKQALS